MQAGDKRLVKFMEGNDIDFVIPVYQRGYDWQIEQCKRLWDDLITIIKSGRSHFFGSIVSVVTPSPNVTEYMIIDGQQRLTTVSLIMAALCNLIDSGDLEDPNNLSTMVKNEYLINKYRPFENKLRLKVIKTDKDSYDRIIGDDKNYDFSKAKNMYKNYSFYREMFLNNKGSYTVDQYVAALKLLFIVDIQLKAGEDDPQLIFESLNSTGLALSEADKIRNFVLMNLNSKQQEDYYFNYWTNIEENSINVKNGVSDFIRDYLTFKLRRIPRADRVYFEFKDYVELSAIPTLDVLKDLLRYSRFYKTITTGNHPNKEISNLLKDLFRLDNKVSYPYLLEVFNDSFEGIISEPNLKEILIVLESYLFRRTVCNIPSNALNKLFSSLEKDIRKHEGYKEQYVEIFKFVLLEKQSSSRFPSDEEFNQSLFSRDLYNIQSKSKVYLLEKLENYNNKETVDLSKLLNEGVLTIEHVMPQTLTPIWEKELGPNFEEIHSIYLHTLGNLTLTAYNSEYQNYPFSKKRDMDHGFKESKLKLNDYISKADVWGEHQIQERARLLIKISLKRWKSPVSSFVPKKNEGFTYSIDDEQSFMYSQIVSYEYQGREFVVTSWADFYKQVMQSLYDQDDSVINSILNDQYFAPELKTMFTDDVTRLISPYKLSDGVFVEVHMNTNSKLKVLKKLLNYYFDEENNIRFTIRDDVGIDESETIDDLDQENLGRGISPETWIELFKNPKVFKKENLDLIDTLYSSSDHKMQAKKLAAIINTKPSTMNLQIMHLGKRVIDETKIPDQFRADGSRRFWNLFFITEIKGDLVTWELRPEIVDSMKEMK